MTYMVVLIAVVTLSGGVFWSRYKENRDRRQHPGALPARIPSTESRLVVRLLSGELDQAGYQWAMADLAQRTEQPESGVETGVLVGADGDPRTQLAMLGVALPELQPSVLCRAFVLAQHGASAAALVSQLNLTKWQAATIVAAGRQCPQ